MSLSPSAKTATLETVHVFFCTHLDIGYTDTPGRVAWKMKEHLDTALRLCREYPDFLYTIETAWVLRQWLERTDDPAARREMADRLREGRLELCAAFATQHAPVCGPEDLNQLCYDARRLAEEMGIEVVSVMQNDVPGYPWGYPQILRKSGIRYFLAGINTILGGALSLPPAHNPFLWEGLDGSRILTFVQDGYCHYINRWKYFQKFIDGADLDTIGADLKLYLDHLAANHYPYAVFGMIANPCDNRGPLENLAMFQRMREWNESGRVPRFVVSTPRRYFEDLIRRHGEEFAVYRGDWNPSWAWTGVKTRGPVGTVAFRRAQARLPIAEKLHTVAALTRGTRFPVPEARAAWDRLLHYGEHSAPEGGGDHRRLTRREILLANREHYEYATRGFHDTEMLLELGTLELARAVRTREFDTVAVFNPSGWARSGLVRVMTGGAGFDSYAEPRRLAGVVDLATGEESPCDTVVLSEAGGDGCGPDAQPGACFVAREVPPMGYRLYRALPATGQEQAIPSCETVADGVVCIENEKYRLEVDAVTGSVQSVLDKELDAEIAAGELGAFNAVESDTPVAGSGVVVRRTVGRTFQRIEIRRPGSWFPETDIRLDAGAPHVEWRNVFDRAAWKALNPERSVWHVGTRFPLALRGSAARIVVSGPSGFRRVPEDSLLDAACDSLPVCTFLAADDGERCVVVASPTDYLFLPPQREERRLVLRSQTVSQGFGPVGLRFAPSQVMPSLEPGEDGILAHRYALTSHAGPFAPVRAQRFGGEFRAEMPAVFVPNTPAVPGTAYPIPAVPAAVTRSFVRVEDTAGAGCVDIAVFRETLFAGQRFFVLRLQELAGERPREVRVVFCPSLGLQSVARASLTEQKQDPLPRGADGSVTLRVGPFETVTLALEFDRR